MACVPAARFETLKVATPAVIVPVPMAVAPSLNVTVPVGVPTPVAVVVTVAVKVTAFPTVEGFKEDVTAVVVVFLFTTWLTAAEVLVRKVASPPYTAVMEWVPAVRVAVVKVATPAVSVPVPSAVTPSLNVTVPLGVPVAVLVTVAVNITDCPTLEGLSDEVKAVDDAFLFTTWLTAVEVLVRKVASPPYTAVMEWVPAVSAEVEKVATPAVSVPVPSTAAPSLKVTVPLGVPVAVLLTVAVKVTDCPTLEGLSEEVNAVVDAFLFITWLTAVEVLVLNAASPP